MMCLGGENWSLHYVVSNIHNMADTITSAFHTETSPMPIGRVVKWNCSNFTGNILNVDGSCNGTPIRTGFGGIFRNEGGLFLAAYSGRIPHTKDILLAELTAIYHGLKMAIEIGLDNLKCYSDSLTSVKLIQEHMPRFHIYAVLVQNIKDLLVANNFSVHHTLREGNQAADFMANLGSTGNDHLVTFMTPPEGILLLLLSDARGVLFPRA
jgi:ribonuclease HI